MTNLVEGSIEVCSVFLVVDFCHVPFLMGCTIVFVSVPGPVESYMSMALGPKCEIISMSVSGIVGSSQDLQSTFEVENISKLLLSYQFIMKLLL